MMDGRSHRDRGRRSRLKSSRGASMETLTMGVIDACQMKLVEELNAALIQYTPPHFKTISCAITQGVEQGQDALFYDIQCPDFPDEGTTVPNDRVHRAATSLA